MRIAMLGWEFPPHITGGLGTACQGLTRALDAKGHQVTFVLPRPVDRHADTGRPSHARVLAPEGSTTTGPATPAATDSGRPQSAMPRSAEAAATTGTGPAAADLPNTRFVAVPSLLTSPYPGGRAQHRAVPGATSPDGSPIGWALPTGEEASPGRTASGSTAGTVGGASLYQGDLIAEAERYARLVVSLLRSEPFDVIHAHDWLTFPAGIALARVTGRPLVAHIHSTEFDRSGEDARGRICDVERRGLMSALRVIAVSEFTRSMCVRKYGIPAEKIDVVYNGIDNESLQPHPGDGIATKDKVVLFLGRITMQKGPEYFLEAAKKVLEVMPDVKFIVAGSGDFEHRMIELAAEMGIGHRVLFTGFLRGKDVQRAFRMADCYVMPSVSEPFGIAPLEAMRADVPVIISRQSGVSEVIQHALKVDFWDTHDMANKIVAVLRHPPLGQTLREHGAIELKRLTWATTADACLEAYRKAQETLAATALPG